MFCYTDKTRSRNKMNIIIDNEYKKDVVDTYNVISAYALKVGLKENKKVILMVTYKRTLENLKVFMVDMGYEKQI
ncbi:hypothetical protein Lal_00018699 [Lupinus albus]|nr:hypothetical protein Lal_00018699 [Lupinus albus]